VTSVFSLFLATEITEKKKSSRHNNVLATSGPEQPRQGRHPGANYLAMTKARMPTLAGLQIHPWGRLPMAFAMGYMTSPAPRAGLFKEVLTRNTGCKQLTPAP
jgi:hypothetical protein